MQRQPNISTFKMTAFQWAYFSHNTKTIYALLSEIGTTSASLNWQ